MSRRHLDKKPVRANREMRALHARRHRRKAHQDLHAGTDPDNVVEYRARHDIPPKTVRERRVIRHWKTKAWKRRTNNRKARAVTARQLQLHPEQYAA